MECVYDISLLVAIPSFFMLLALLLSEELAVNYYCVTKLVAKNLKSGYQLSFSIKWSDRLHDISFLRCFRDNEKKVFGYRSQVQPCILKVDIPTALIISILEVFNIKKLQDKWCWQAVLTTTAKQTYIP